MEHWIKKSHQQSQQSDQQQPVAEQRNGAGWLDGYAKMPQQAWSNFRNYCSGYWPPLPHTSCSILPDHQAKNPNVWMVKPAYCADEPYNVDAPKQEQYLNPAKGQLNMQSVDLFDLASSSLQNVEVYQAGSSVDPLHISASDTSLYRKPRASFGFSRSNSVEFCRSAQQSLETSGMNRSSILDMASDILVEFVCKQTEPSAYRLAGETLAKSNLNPNAKEFTPKGLLGHYISQQQQRILQDMYKNRKCSSQTGYQEKPQLQCSLNSKDTSNCDKKKTTTQSCISMDTSPTKTHENAGKVVLAVPRNNSDSDLNLDSTSTCGVLISAHDSSTDAEGSSFEDLDPSVDNLEALEGSIGSGSSSSLSSRNVSESSDDSFIQFDKKSPILCSKIRESFENICFDDGADEDVDWDDEEHGDGGLVQLEDFENEFCPGLCISNFTSSSNPPKQSKTKENSQIRPMATGESSHLSDSSIPSSSRHSLLLPQPYTCDILDLPKSEKVFKPKFSCKLGKCFIQCSCRNINQTSEQQKNVSVYRSGGNRSVDQTESKPGESRSVDQSDYKPGEDRAVDLAAANVKWNTEPEIQRKTDVVVRFSGAPDLVILEPDHLKDQLMEARISDFPARQADRERMERLLRPILTAKHRLAVYQRLHQGRHQ